METDKLKSFFTEKKNLYMLVPIVLLLVYFFFFTGNKSTNETNDNSETFIPFEPDSKQEEIPQSKSEVYEKEKRERLKKLREDEFSSIRGNDFYRFMNEREDDYFSRRQDEMMKDVYRSQVLDPASEDAGGTHSSYRSIITDQINNIEWEEYEDAQRRKEEKELYREELNKQNEEALSVLDHLLLPEVINSGLSAPQTNEIEQEEIVLDEPVVETAQSHVFSVVEGKRRRVNQTDTKVNGKTSIKACIHGDQEIVNGAVVRMRLLEKVESGNRIIPKNTIFHGVARISGERLQIEVENINYNDYITPVSYIICGLDAMKGLDLPNSLKAEATKRFQQGLVQGIQLPISSIGTTSSEIASAISVTTQLTRQIFSMSISQVKVPLKAGHLMLIQEETKEAREKRRKEEDEQLEMWSRSLTPQKVDPLEQLLQ